MISIFSQVALGVTAVSGVVALGSTAIGRLSENVNTACVSRDVSVVSTIAAVEAAAISLLALTMEVL